VTTLSPSNSQQNLVAANSARQGLVVNNQSASMLYISPVTGFAKSAAPITVSGMTRWVLPVAYTGALYCRSDGTTGSIHITET
jgi:hypothetical protein